MKHKLILLFAFSVILMLKPLWAQTEEKPDVKAIRTILKTQVDAWNKGDLDGFMYHYWHSPELRFITRKGIKKGWQQVYDGYKKSYPTSEKMGQLVFDIQSIEPIDKKNAMVCGSWKLVSDKDTFEGYFTLWFKKIDGVWVIIMDHTS